MTKRQSAATLETLLAQTGLTAPEDLLVARTVLQQAGVHLLDAIQALETDPGYERQPVDAVTFIQGREYLNLRIGPNKGEVWPRIAEDLVRFFEGNYIELVLFGGIGCGKTTFAELAMLYMIYRCSCLSDPQRTYGLLEGSTIAFANVSINITQAKRVIFKDLLARIRLSPYFRDVFPPNPHVTSELRFPKGIWAAPMGSVESNVLGLHIFGGVMDESNAMAVVGNSKLAVDGRAFDTAVEMYNAIYRRIYTRFMEQGEIPGKLIALSSSKHPDDFTERKAREAETNPQILALRYAIWEVKPRSTFLPETFRVEVGDAVHLSRVLEAGEAPRPDAEILEPPLDFLPLFKTDPDGAVRDIGGRAKVAVSAYIKRRDTIEAAIDTTREHPFPTEDLVSAAEFPLIVERLVSRGQNGGGWKPRWHPTLPRTAHVDLGLTKDAAGIAIGCSPGFKRVLRVNPSTGEQYEDSAPLLWYDVLVSVRAPQGGEVDFAGIRRSLLLPLHQLGFRLRRVTYDGWQSQESVQAWRAIGIESDVLSVDLDTAAYDALKDALYEGRVSWYRNEILRKELVGLQLGYKNNKPKVDHPSRGSKDLSDAAAGVAHHWTLDPPRAPVVPLPGAVETVVTGLPFSKEDYTWLMR